MDIVYVLESTVLAGGVKNVFEQADRLADLGYRTQLFALGGQPEWFPLRTMIRQFPNYSIMSNELKEMDAIKVATWWKTAQVVWNCCDPKQGGCGIPFYLVQDIEESYYTHWPAMGDQVRQTYNIPMPILTIAEWTTNQLLEHYRRDAIPISIAIDQEVFKPCRSDGYDPYRIVACSRKSQPLKGYDITVQAVKAVYRELPQIAFDTYGLEDPGIYGIPGHHLFRPDDRTIAQLYSNCGVFVQTSYHEGFGLPILEAMACGTPVVVTRAEGNEEFCHHEKNCVMVEKGDVEGVAQGIVRVLTDREFAASISAQGRETARTYDWAKVLHRLDHIFGPYAGKR
ncbi:glycosyltransferase family 4 protein [Cohnella sp.]|uniref:glycosyltransferase family 4 protein n=1 Tax=Cohnella sp. TaxID=1883426 RepID=UPI003569D97C